MSPLVSVLLPARDAAATLAAALGSVQRQTFLDWECIVADDGSRDGTAALVKEVARQDLRVRRVPLARAGLVPALHAGRSECRGAFVARMDADDLMHRERIDAQVEALRAALGAMGFEELRDYVCAA